MNQTSASSIVFAAGLLAGCGSPPAAMNAAQPQSCAAAAARVAADNPVRGATLRITRAEDQAAAPDAKAHCLVEGAINERVSAVDGRPYAIKFRMRMPRPENWNGKFFMQGVGGSNGILDTGYGLYSGMTSTAFSRGYAVIVQDSGHDNAVNSDPDAGGQSAFARDPQARIDFGYNSYDVTTQIGKAVVGAFYAKPPEHSYFLSCSDGGRQAVGIAQRFPQYYDGIVAGAPAMSIPYMTAYVPHLLQTLAPLAIKSGHIDANGRPLINKVYSDADLHLVSNAILDACDAQDGLKDGIANNLAACTDAVVVPKLTALTCTGDKAANCLTGEQVSALRKSFAGPKTSAGAQIYPGNPWDPGIGGLNGAEYNQGFRAFWFGAYAASTNTATKLTLSAPQAALLWKTPPTVLSIPQSMDYFMKYNVDDTEASITRTTDLYRQPVVEWGMSNSPDLSKFKQSGGKMISWIGNADPAVSPNETIAWYNRVNEREAGMAQDFLKLFVVPGMNHCAGGMATDRFDMLTALEAWVERRTPPASVPAEASKPGYFGAASRSRPLCPYPQYAHYKGSGDINLAGNFSCQQAR